MPTSVYEQLSVLTEIIFALKPRSVLDIGAGTGKYGLLAREYLDIWGSDGQYGKNNWKNRIDAIEAFEAYISPVHEYIYDHVYIGDAVEIVPKLSSHYELTLLIDVLEHIQKEKGQELLKILRGKSETILISLPRNVKPQKDYFGNSFEHHRSQWYRDDFLEIGPCHFIHHGKKLICLMGDKGMSSLTRFQRKKLRSRILAQFPFLAWIYSPLKRVGEATLYTIRKNIQRVVGK